MIVKKSLGRIFGAATPLGAVVYHTGVKTTHKFQTLLTVETPPRRRTPLALATSA
jgi:hypothetical protein